MEQQYDQNDRRRESRRQLEQAEDSDWFAQHCESAGLLNQVLAGQGTLHLPGARERHRAQLCRVLELSSRVLSASEQDTVPAEVIVEARTSQVLAHVARAEDARHGAGQLSRSAQRAPTDKDCEDGWRRVEGIVLVAEESARAARQLAREGVSSRAARAVQTAEAAARDARCIVQQRNEAYTFHADPSFSFGEGWYLAAAALLQNLTIQLEPDRPHTSRARRFLVDAGLGNQLVAYRSRPRANKALPDIVARAFRADAVAAQAKLRTAFLGGATASEAIRAWADERLSTGSSVAAEAPRLGVAPKVLIWLRYARYHSNRNTTYAELCALCRLAVSQQLVPILVGDGLRADPLPKGALDLTLFWKLPLFQGEDMRRAQLQLFEYLRQRHRLVGQVGVTTAGMDGPALMGLPTLYLTEEPNVRLGKWVGAVPGYEEVVRDGHYLERVSRRLQQWAGLFDEAAAGAAGNTGA